MSQSILIASDHAGTELKASLIKKFGNHDFEDLGTDSLQSVDYPYFAQKVASVVSKVPSRRGILICGSGIGMSIAANRFPHVRAALVFNPEMAKLSREHNDANILCLGSRFLSTPQAEAIVKIWLETAFSGEPRHQNRVSQLK